MSNTAILHEQPRPPDSDKALEFHSCSQRTTSTGAYICITSAGRSSLSTYVAAATDDRLREALYSWLSADRRHLFLPQKHRIRPGLRQTRDNEIKDSRSDGPLKSSLCGQLGEVFNGKVWQLQEGMGEEWESGMGTWGGGGEEGGSIKGQCLWSVCDTHPWALQRVK